MIAPALTAAVLLATSVSGQPAPAVTGDVVQIPMSASDAAETEAVADRFFRRLQTEGSSSGAIRELFEGTPLAGRTLELQQLTSSADLALSLIGPIRSWSLVRSENFGASIYRQTYVAEAAEAPLVVYFYFYRTDDGWASISIYLTTEPASLF